MSMAELGDGPIRPTSIETATATTIVATETIYVLIAMLSCDQMCNDFQWLLSVMFGCLTGYSSPSRHALLPGTNRSRAL